jgi:hypothetical protein
MLLAGQTILGGAGGILWQVKFWVLVPLLPLGRAGLIFWFAESFEGLPCLFGERLDEDFGVPRAVVLALP